MLSEWPQSLWKIKNAWKTEDVTTKKNKFWFIHYNCVCTWPWSIRASNFIRSNLDETFSHSNELSPFAPSSDRLFAAFCFIAISSSNLIKSDCFRMTDILILNRFTTSTCFALKADYFSKLDVVVVVVFFFCKTLIIIIVISISFRSHVQNSKWCFDQQLQLLYQNGTIFKDVSELRAMHYFYVVHVFESIEKYLTRPWTRYHFVKKSYTMSEHTWLLNNYDIICVLHRGSR